MGKILTFDRKVVETQFFNQNDRNWLLKKFPTVWGHFALKCFLDRLIGQLVILGRKSQNFTMLTPVWYLRTILYPRVLQWVQRINQKKLQAPIHPEDPFSLRAPMPKHGHIRPKVNFWQEGCRDSIFLPTWSEWHFKIISPNLESFSSKMLP